MSRRWRWRVGFVINSLAGGLAAQGVRWAFEATGIYVDSSNPLALLAYFLIGVLVGLAGYNIGHAMGWW